MNTVIDGYTRPDASFTAADLLRQMDAAGVARAVIGPMDHEYALHNAEGNKRMAGLAATHPDRFIPACAVTPWHGPKARGMLEQAVHAGARLLMLAPAVQGFMLTDDVVDPLLECAAELGLAVYVHTGPHANGAPAQVVLAGRKHVSTRFIIGHCGSTDHAWDMPAIAARHLGSNLWLETSLVRPWAIPAYLKAAGPDRLVFGSAAPLNDMRFELDQVGGHLPREEHPGFYGGNLLKLLGETKGS